ncbi:hypothetical protein CORC01_10021, partial [Colletotrichum orchidophilum]
SLLNYLIYLYIISSLSAVIILPPARFNPFYTNILLTYIFAFNINNPLFYLDYLSLSSIK